LNFDNTVSDSLLDVLKLFTVMGFSSNSAASNRLTNFGFDNSTDGLPFGAVIGRLWLGDESKFMSLSSRVSADNRTVLLLVKFGIDSFCFGLPVDGRYSVLNAFVGADLSIEFVLRSNCDCDLSKRNEMSLSSFEGFKSDLRTDLAGLFELSFVFPESVEEK